MYYQAITDALVKTKSLLKQNTGSFMAKPGNVHVEGALS